MINGFHRHFNGGRGDDGQGDDDNGIQVILEVKGTMGGQEQDTNGRKWSMADNEIIMGRQVISGMCNV